MSVQSFRAGAQMHGVIKIGLFAALWLAGATPLHAETNGPEAGKALPRIAGIAIVGETPTIVFDHLRDKQQIYNLPDAAATAWREADGQVSLVISHLENYRMRGPNLHDVTIDPHEIFSSEKQAERIPEGDYNYNSWLVSPYTQDGKTIYGLMHMEWYGCLLNDDCTDPVTGADYTSGSWVTTIDQFVSRDGGAHWAPNGRRAAHTVARLGNIWTGSEALKQKIYITGTKNGIYDLSGMPGHTRLIHQDSHYYAVGLVSIRDFSHIDFLKGLAPLIGSGMVVFRTTDFTTPSGWEIWAGGSSYIPISQAKITATYGADPDNPVSTNANYTIFNPTSNASPSQIIHDLKSGQTILIFNVFGQTGLYYITTPSLAAPVWSKPRPVERSRRRDVDAFVTDPRADANDPAAKPACTTYAAGFIPANYPSILDATSPGLNFEYANGHPELYYVVNPSNYPGRCQGDNLARDLYRIGLEIGYGTPAE